MNHPPQPQAARFSVKFTNGYWKIFDNVKYADDALHYTREGAEESCERANAWASSGHRHRS